MTGVTIADRRVHPATIVLRVLREAPQTLLGLPAGYAFLSKNGLSQILLFAAGIALLAVLYQWLSWSRFRYGIGAGEIVIESGMLSRTRRSIPFSRIQDVDIEQGLLARLFGLAKLRIETGGSGADEGVLDSVSTREARRLRHALREARSVSPAEPSADAHARPTIFALTPQRLLLAGFFNFSMVYLAGVFAVLQTFDRLLPFDIYDPARWIGFGREELGGRFSIGAIVAVAIVAVLLGVVTSVARTIGRDFGFRLTLEDAGLRRRRGLLTRSDVLIPTGRIQLSLTETGPFRRALGFSTVHFQTLSAGKGEEAGRQLAAPLATAAEAGSIFEAAGASQAADPSSLSLVSRRHFLRRSVIYVVPLLVTTVAASLVWRWALLGLLLVPMILGKAYFERLFHLFGLDGDTLFIRQGVWRQREWAIPRTRIESVSLTRGWLQRKLGLATLAIDTAGAPLMGGPRIVDLRESDARSLVRMLRISE